MRAQNDESSRSDGVQRINCSMFLMIAVCITVAAITPKKYCRSLRRHIRRFTFYVSSHFIRHSREEICHRSPSFDADATFDRNDCGE